MAKSNGKVSSTLKVLTEIRDELRGLRGQVDELTTDVRHIKAELAEQQGLEADIADLRRRVEALERRQ